MEQQCQCSLAVEHSLSKREVVGSIPAIGSFFFTSRFSFSYTRIIRLNELPECKFFLQMGLWRSW